MAQISFAVHPAHPAGEEAEAAAGLAAAEEAVRVAGPGTSGPAATGTVGAHTRGGCNIGAGKAQRQSDGGGGDGGAVLPLPAPETSEWGYI